MLPLLGVMLGVVLDTALILDWLVDPGELDRRDCVFEMRRVERDEGSSLDLLVLISDVAVTGNVEFEKCLVIVVL